MGSGASVRIFFVIQEQAMTNATSKRSLVQALVAVFVLSLGCSQADPSPPADTRQAHPTTEGQLMNDIESLQQVEKVWVDSLTTGDSKLLATIIDKEFTFIGPDAQVEEREAYLAGYEEMSKLGVVVERIDVSDVKFRVLGEIGIVTGRVLATVKMQGTPMTEDVRFTRVYQRSPSGWQMVAGQGTRIPAEPPKG
jgi:ketosteroid isomerase-like protein